jgi:excisionase family DNA binding protein
MFFIRRIETAKPGGNGGMNPKEAYRTILREYPDILDADQLSLILSVSKKTAYGILKRGDISSLKVGREYKIPKINLLEYLRVVDKT